MFQLTPLPINISYWIQQVQRPEIGAMELFIGMTRNHKEDRGILSLYYEAYEEMVGKSALSLWLAALGAPWRLLAVLG